MHSRAILTLGLFAFACLLVTGSLALHLTLAQAGGSNSVSSVRLSLASGDAPAEGSDPFPAARDGTGPGASTREAIVADTLEILLTGVYERFEQSDSDVTSGMIPYLAEMITTMNQNDEFVYRVEITDPDAALARRRAQTLNDVLRLNVRIPSRLRIIGSQGPRAARVRASVE